VTARHGSFEEEFVPKVIVGAERMIAKVLPRTWSPNQVVAHNVTRARLLRGWTQDQAAEALAPYLGSRLSVASLSAIERSIAGTRVKQFTADELVAMSRAFGVPLGWWLTPPNEGSLHTPDHERLGIDFAELADIVLGTPDTLPPWIEALRQWAAQHASASKRAAPLPDPAARTATHAELRAQTLVRERFGDLAETRDVLRRLADLLDQLDDPRTNGTPQDQTAPSVAAAPAQRTSRSRRETKKGPGGGPPTVGGRQA